VCSLTSRSDAILLQTVLVKNKQPNSLTLVVLILFYRRQFRELGFSRNLHKLCCLCLLQGRFAGLLRPRPFLNKLSNALVSRKFCERHKYKFFFSSTIFLKVTLYLASVKGNIFLVALPFSFKLFSYSQMANCAAQFKRRATAAQLCTCLTDFD